MLVIMPWPWAETSKYLSLSTVASQDREQHVASLLYVWIAGKLTSLIAIQSQEAHTYSPSNRSGASELL